MDTQLIKKTDTFKLIIPQDVEAKIRFTCQKIHDTEWSGVLFVDYKGTIYNKDLEITCKDFFIMDIGSSTYTEFQNSPDVMNYMVTNDLLDCKMGLVHSHCTFGTFFSGTDVNTLLEEGKDTQSFVSLIVNNAGTYTAAVTDKVTHTRKVEDCVSTNLFGDRFEENCQYYTETYDEIEYYYLNITKEGNNFDDITARLEEIKEAKKNRPVFTTDTNQIKSIADWGRKFESVKHIVPKDTFKGIDEKYNTWESQRREKEKTLFDDNKWDDMPVPYDDIKINPDVINNILVQLITGSIVLSPNKFDAKEWAANSMVRVFDKRFTDDKEFSTFSDIITDYLTSEIKDEETFEAIDGDISTYQALTAYYLITTLEDLGVTNKYINTYINSLTDFII